jgi:chromosome partitioning protein
LEWYFSAKPVRSLDKVKTFMGRIYTFANQKGGVGKTTSAINLGAYLANYDQRVLVVDLDPQANATSSLRVDKYGVKGGTYEVLINGSHADQFILHNPRLKLSLLPSTPALAGSEVELVTQDGRERFLQRAIEPIAERYNYVLIDCPPSLGLLTLNGLVAAKDGVIIPVQCEYLALEGLTLLMSTLDRIRSAIYPGLQVRGLLLTMFDGRTNLAADVVREVRKHFQSKVFKTIVPRTIRLAEAPSYGLPISDYAPSSSGAVAYSELAREILEADGAPISEPQE